MKKVQSKAAPPLSRKAFNYRPDEIRARQLADLIRKTGAKQQGIVSMAISLLHEREFPDRNK